MTFCFGGIMQELHYLSATEIVSKIKKKQVSCKEVMEAHLRRIAQVNPILNAIIQAIDPEEALKQAKEADRVLNSGEPVGRLHGLPITIKDSLKVKGFSDSCACRGLKRGPAEEDATVVSRLKKEGAIVLGLTNVPELLLSIETDNAMYGQTKNPYNLERTPGGSSGGEAAIIAAGGSPLGIGSDAGGSIRVPAHNAGIAGIKPTQGRIPSTGNTLGNTGGLFSYVASNGPMARTVDDLILSLSIISGPNGNDPHAMPIPFKDPSQVNLKSLKIAFFTDDGYATPTKETQNTVRDAAFALKEYVHQVDENRPQDSGRAFRLLWETIFLGGDKGASLKHWMQLMGIHNPSPHLQEYVQMAELSEFSVSDLRLRMMEIDQYKIDMLNFIQPYDAIICPVAATPAKPHGRALKEIKDFNYTMSHNLTGWPGVVVRCGTSQEGLPIGVQVLAKPWQDDVALAVARVLENCLGGWKPPLL